MRNKSFPHKKYKDTFLEYSMVSSRSGYWIRFNWWIAHEAIKYVILAAIVIILSYFGVIWILWVAMGIIFTLFNRQAYEFMVRYSFWMSKKIGGREIARATKTTFYRRLYKTSLFIVGLILLDLGMTDGKITGLIFNKLGLI